MSAQIAYRPDIDGLRTIAVGSVVLYHAFAALIPGGFVGVDIFFVISGFLITGILVLEHERTGRIDLAKFYARRVRRLLPALLAMVTTTLALGLWLVPAEGELQSLAQSALATLFFASNIFFALQPSGYFAEAVEVYPLLHTWTLAVEEQFYIVWPLLIPSVAWLASKAGLSRRTALWTLFLAMFAGSLASSLAGTIFRPTWAFYLTPFRGWEFALGALLSLGLRGDAPRWHHGATALSVVGLLLIGVSIQGIDHNSPFPGWVALLPTLGAASLLAGGAISPANPVARLLSTRPAVYVGKLSYGWYLWHWPLLALVRANALGASSDGRLIAAVIASFLLSAFSFHVIEAPIRHQSWRAFHTTRSSLIAGAAILITGALLAIGTLAIARHRQSASPRLQGIATALQATDIAPYFPGPCNNYQAKFNALAPFETCLLGQRDARRIIVVVGDSHAYHLIPMLDRWGRRNRMAILPRTRGGCRPLDGDAGVIGLPPTAANLADCRQFTNAVFHETRMLAATGRVTAVVVGSRWPDSGVPTTVPGDPAKTIAGRETGIVRLAALADAGKFRLVLVRDTPLFPHNVPYCLARRSPMACAISRGAADAQRAEATRTIAKVAAAHRNVRIFDPSAAICDDSVCHPVAGDLVLFKDDHHLAPLASYVLEKRLQPALDAALVRP